MNATSLIPAETPETDVVFSSDTIPSSESRLQSCVRVCGKAGVLPLASRIAAGRLLGRELKQQTFSEPLVLAVSAGAVEVAQQISDLLAAPLDLLFSKDVCLPWQRDIVLATVNSDGGRIVDETTCRSLRLSRYFVYNCVSRTENDLQRRVRAYRGGAPSPSRLRKTIILVDDGEARPSHLAGAIKSLRKHDAAQIVFASPIACLESVKAVATGVNLCLLLGISDPLRPASAYYLSFPEISEDLVQEKLKPQKALESLSVRTAVAAGY